MARMELNGLDEFAFDFGELARLPENVINEMLIAEGDIIREAQSFYAAKMLQGPYYRGGVAAGVKRGNVKRAKGGKALYVTFEGEQHGNRLPEIAFINEFGKRSQPPRQFIRTANEENAETAVNAAAEIYDDYLKSLGF